MGRYGCEHQHRKRCSDCARAATAARGRAYYQAHKEQAKAKNRAHYEANKERIAAAVRSYYQANRGVVSARRRVLRAANPEPARARARAWAAANPERKAAMNRAYHVFRAPIRLIEKRIARNTDLFHQLEAQLGLTPQQEVSP